MFTGTIESLSHEGGLLVTFTGSSPALESIITDAATGDYIGKVDSVLGNTNSPLVHVAHIERKLDIQSLIGKEVGVRSKKPREERQNDRDQRRNRDGGRDDRRGSRDERRQERSHQPSEDWDCPECRNNNYSFRQNCNRCEAPRPSSGRSSARRDERYGGRDDRRGRDGGRDSNRSSNRDGGADNSNDWECPKCQNNNFSFRAECNRCGLEREGGAPRPGRQGNDRRGGRDGGYQDRRDGGRDRFSRSDNRRGGNENRMDGDWECPKCHNNNFARRNECNRCGLARSGGGGGGGYGGRDGGRDSGRSNDRRDSSPRGKPEGSEFRHAKGKKPGHAHNRGPSEIRPQNYERNQD